VPAFRIWKRSPRPPAPKRWPTGFSFYRFKSLAADSQPHFFFLAADTFCADPWPFIHRSRRTRRRQDQGQAFSESATSAWPKLEADGLARNGIGHRADLSVVLRGRVAVGQVHLLIGQVERIVRREVGQLLPVVVRPVVAPKPASENKAAGTGSSVVNGAFSGHFCTRS